MKKLCLILIVIICACKKSENNNHIDTRTQIQIQDSILYYSHLNYMQNIDSIGLEIGKIYTVYNSISGINYLWYPLDSPNGYGIEHSGYTSDTIVFNKDSTVTETYSDLKFARTGGWNNVQFFFNYGAKHTINYKIKFICDTINGIPYESISIIGSSLPAFNLNENFLYVLNQNKDFKTRITYKNDTLFFSSKSSPPFIYFFSIN